MYEARIEKHSVTTHGVELVTFEVNYPHAVHKDVMTHRWARNFQSFRAVPPEKLLERLELGEHFTPERFSSRVTGMGRGNVLDTLAQQDALDIWNGHVIETTRRARKFLEIGLAKEQVNFLLQDLCFIRGIITTTLPQLENFFGLRLAKDDDGNPLARLEVYKIAEMMLEAYQNSTPWVIRNDEWHLPFVRDEELYNGNAVFKGPIEIDWDYWRKVSVGRCARVSYLTHSGTRDPSADVDLHDRLLYDGHMSPFEHQGTPQAEALHTGNSGSFGHGWIQYRKLIPGEEIFNPDVKYCARLG